MDWFIVSFMCRIVNREVVLEFRVKMLIKSKVYRYLLVACLLYVALCGYYILLLFNVYLLWRLSLDINKQTEFCVYLSELTCHAKISSVIDDEYVMVSSGDKSFPFKGVIKEGHNFILDCMDLTVKECD